MTVTVKGDRVEVRADLATIDAPTLKMAHELQTAYRWFNGQLFGDKLKDCVILMHRKRSAYGYFWASRWKMGEADDAPTYHEIALNPDTLKGREVREVLSTLVHEQVHLWQQEFGKPAKNAGHNKEWANKMEEVGLMPSRTGQPDGKRTGKRVSHYILEGEEFDRACRELLETGFTLSCVSWPQLKVAKKKTRRVTVECPACEARARVKEGVTVRCGECVDEESGEHHLMEEC